MEQEQILEKVIVKLARMDYKNDSIHDIHKSWDNNWTEAERLRLLQIYYVISKYEDRIFDLVYMSQGCDTWEDIFRDYSSKYLEDKADGVKSAIDTIHDRKR